MHQVLNEKIPYFSDDGLSCAESSLRYLIEHGYADLPLDTVRIMTGLHGNMGRCANCGAVNGCVAAIGAVKSELGARYAVAVFAFQVTVAWIVAFVVHSAGMLLGLA